MEEAINQLAVANPAVSQIKRKANPRTQTIGRPRAFTKHWIRPPQSVRNRAQSHPASQLRAGKETKLNQTQDTWYLQQLYANTSAPALFGARASLSPKSLASRAEIYNFQMELATAELLLNFLLSSSTPAEKWISSMPP